MPAAAPRRGAGRRAGGGGEEGTRGPRGEIPASGATSRGRAGRPGPPLASCPRPQPPPSRSRVFTGPGAGARPPRSRLCILRGPRGEWGLREPEGERTDDAHAGKGGSMLTSLGADAAGQRSEGSRATDEHSLPRQLQTREPLLPTALAPQFRPRGPSHWGLTLSSRPGSVRPGRPHSPPPPPNGAGLRLPRGLQEGEGEREGAAPPPAGEGSASLRRARPGCLAPGVLCLRWGRPGPAALCPRGLPSSNSRAPCGETTASEMRSGLLDAGRETGAAPEAWEAHLPSRWKLRGGKVHEERSLSSPEPAAPALRWRPSLLSRAA